MGIIIALLIFGIIITVHEFGHFAVAKLCNVKVLEFSVGMGPKLLQKQKGETKYSLRLLPVGGFCQFEGEDTASDDPRSYSKAPVWKRMLILFAGAGMNFVLGFITLIIMLSMFTSIPTTSVEGFYGEELSSGEILYYSESYHTGLRHDDVIKEIDGISIYSLLDIDFVQSTSKKQKHEVVVERGGEELILNDVVFRDRRDGSVYDFGVEYVKKTPGSIIKASGNFFRSMGHIVAISLKQLVTGKAETDDIQGPVGVVSTINQTTKQSESAGDAFFQLVYMTSLITINLGIMNLLPIPGLDGCKLLFCIVEIFRGKPLKPEHEGYVTLTGMVILVGLMIFVTFNDIVRLFN